MYTESVQLLRSPNGRFELCLSLKHLTFFANFLMSTSPTER
jgi:hypothetical protein